MKLLFVSANYPPETKGGGEISTHFLAQSLMGLGYEVSVITSGEQEKSYVVDGVAVRQLPLNLKAKPLLEERHAQKSAAIFRNLVKDLGDFDIVHAHDFRSALMLSELSLTKVVATVRDYAQICGSPNNLLADGSYCPGCESIFNVVRNQAVAEAPLWRKPFRVWQYRFNIGYRLSAFRKIKHQVFISEAQREIITARQDMRGISSKVIYNPVGKDFIKEPVNIHKSNDFLFVGTLQKYKGVDLLLEAFKKVSNEYPHARLKIVGQGDTLERYQAFMARSGLTYRVEFLGRVDPHKIIEIYDQVGILVAPHIWAEPFGRTVVEAMSRGKIVIAADTGGPGEIIKNGVTGLLFKTGSVNDLERSLREVLEMPDIDRREISQAARGWVQHNLNSEKISRQYEEFYSKIRL